jgi:hypothetical protein
MCHRRLARLLLCPALLLSTASGCQAFIASRDVTVVVRDAESKKPIPGAEVSIYYLHLIDPFAPAESGGTTGPDGAVRLRAAPYPGLFMEAQASGYLGQGCTSALEGLETIEPANWLTGRKQRPVVRVVELYCEPGPTVELVLPDGYRGIVKVVEALDDRPAAGKRRFTFPVPPSGVVEMRGPRVLAHATALEFTARYANGTPLPRDGTAVGLRWLEAPGDGHYFVVGTQADLDDGYRLFHKKNAQGSWVSDEGALAAWEELHRPPSPPPQPGRPSMPGTR